MSDQAAYWANLERGRLLRESGRLAEACTFLGKAIEADCQKPDAYLQLALALSGLPGRKAESITTMDRAVMLEPNSAYYLGYRAYLQSDLGRHKEALESSYIALEKNPNEYIALLAQANAYTKSTRWEKAESAARRMLEINPDDVAGLNLLAQSLRFQDRFEESREIVAQILARVPNDSFGHANAGYDALKCGDHRRANECFLTALKFDPNCDFARGGFLQSLRARIWIYRINMNIMMFMGDNHSTAGYRTITIILSIVTGGAFLGLLFLYIILALTLQPLSNFFLLMEPKGRRALNRKECIWATVTGAGACVLLLVLALTGLIELYEVVGAYFLIFALCVYIPQWSDLWHARREKCLSGTKWDPHTCRTD